MVLLLAILEKRVGLYLSSSDAYINVIGGMRLDEPAIDLPIALAVASSYRDQPLPEGVMSFGEVGLTGELRAVTVVSQRIPRGDSSGLYDLHHAETGHWTHGDSKNLPHCTDGENRTGDWCGIWQGSNDTVDSRAVKTCRNDWIFIMKLGSA